MWKDLEQFRLFCNENLRIKLYDFAEMYIIWVEHI